MPEPAFRFPPGPEAISSEAVFLRTPTTDDAALLVEASHDPEIIRWTRMRPNLDDAAAAALLVRWRALAVDGLLRQYVVARSSADAPVGLTSLILQDADDPWCADVVYWLLPRGRHLGLITGAVTVLLQWAIEETTLRRAVLYTLEGNAPSERVAKRCHFRLDGLVDDACEGRPLRLNRWAFQPDWSRQSIGPNWSD